MLWNAHQLHCPLTDGVPQETDSKTKFREQDIEYDVPLRSTTAGGRRKEPRMATKRSQARMQAQGVLVSEVEW